MSWGCLIKNHHQYIWAERNIDTHLDQESIAKLDKMETWKVNFVQNKDIGIVTKLLLLWGWQHYFRDVAKLCVMLIAPKNILMNQKLRSYNGIVKTHSVNNDFNRVRKNVLSLEELELL